MISKKLLARIENPGHVGTFTELDVEGRGIRLAIGKAGSVEEGKAAIFYLLVDEMDGIIADAKFQAFGPALLLGAAEAACEFIIRKDYARAHRFNTDLLDKQLRDNPEKPAFPPEASPFLDLLLSAIEQAALQCMDIALTEPYTAPAIDLTTVQGEGYPGWHTLSKSEKMDVIEDIIARDVRPYIELDAGGIQIIDFCNEREVLIAYQGACTSCHSATGATLNAIQQVLHAKVSSDLVVIPML